MHSLLDPAILFFAFGMLAGALKSNLEIPAPVSKFLSLYLLMALGLKGGFALAESGVDASMATDIVAAMALALIVPALGYRVLRRYVGPFDAAAVAAAYGSVSAVTFVTTMQFLEARGVGFGGHMTVAMVLMESPAIVMAVLLAHALRAAPLARTGLAMTPGGAAVLAAGAGGGGEVGPGVRGPAGASPPWAKVLRDSFTDGAHLLLLGAMAIGALSGQAGKEAMQPFTSGLFKGLLAFFLLDMGLTVARNFAMARAQSAVLLGYGVLAPLVHAGIALAVAVLLGMAPGNGVLLMVLSASASYIVVPAVLRHAVPEANPSLYMGLSLGVTFPLNLLVGIPLYTATAQAVLG